MPSAIVSKNAFSDDVSVPSTSETISGASSGATYARKPDAGAIADDRHVEIAHADRQPRVVGEREREVTFVIGARGAELCPHAFATREHVDVFVLERLVDDRVRDPAFDRLRVGARGRRRDRSRGVEDRPPLR